ncbi:hypothetical protein [Streptomyces sp. NPDC050546]|uniref:hypothetical protein n=1 Tax=Streptomyces sp. NPDC050546 TaxID=3365628 RepID=UPI00378C4DBB
MNGIDHYKRAEKLLADAHEPGITQPVTGEVLSYKHGHDERAHMIRSAHVHALLANTAALADTPRFQEDLYAGNGEEPPVREARKRRAADKSRDAAEDYL